MSRVYHLSKKAYERGSYTVKFTFKDHNKLEINSGKINNIYWWLTDSGGTVINLRSRVIPMFISNPLFVTVSNEDLQITEKDRGDNIRLLTIRGDYNSTLGLGLPFSYTVSFSIVNEVVIDIDLLVSVIDHAFVGEFVYV